MQNRKGDDFKQSKNKHTIALFKKNCKKLTTYKTNNKNVISVSFRHVMQCNVI